MDFKSYLEKKHFEISRGEDRVPFAYSIHYEHLADFRMRTFENISQGDLRRINAMDEYLNETQVSAENFVEMLKILPDKRFLGLLFDYSNGFKKAIDDLKSHGSLYFVEKSNQHQNKTKQTPETKHIAKIDTTKSNRTYPSDGVVK